MFAVRDEDAALDIVQDAMLKLTEKYSDKPAAELPMLFQRILQNTIHDHFRRQKVRSTWTTLLSALGQRDEKDDDYDPLETLPAKSDSNSDGRSRRARSSKAQIVGMIEQALARLPARQREAFLLRYWEELDVAETAAAMGCSEGSVKTHCSRAVHALAEMLKAKGYHAMNDQESRIRQQANRLPRPGAADLRRAPPIGCSRRAPRRSRAQPARTRRHRARAGRRRRARARSAAQAAATRGRAGSARP